MKQLKKQLVWVYGLLFSLAYAGDPDKTLRFEEIPFKHSQIYCDNDKHVFPEENSFKLLDYSAMSSDEGERYILATIENTSSGTRILKEEHIVAILGNCARFNPVAFEKKFGGREILTLRLLLGESRYPILKVVI